MEDRLDSIVNGMQQKSATKQLIFRNTKETFAKLKEVAREVVDELSERITQYDANIIIEYKEINEYEFNIKFSGDLLIFIMHSNIITFPDDYKIMQSSYVQEDFRRRFFGHIMAYNFMADSIKYGRLDDPGYLIGRMLINFEKHFCLEGVKQMDLPFEGFSKNPLKDEDLRIIVESAMIAAVNNDLMGQDVSDIEKISLKQKFDNMHLTSNKKLGFMMNHQLTH
ncbi:hypothetical protein [Pontibacter sp. SGAir0037]|uniref:hypothetical protein n=1 Tax=Pontibacter sp. SGAir0037 TaxID=2571030 RepID=UPI0010CCBD0C|nr:hypothetical protein [Pontibacter sp. SGAir0037]QCR25049.1 hypothetical protein C1N53_12285 [Pontibacter sp. SGAir0037]